MRDIAAGIVAVAAFLLVLLVLDLPLAVAIGAGLVFYVGLLLLLGRAPGPTESLPEVPGLTEAEVRRTIHEARRKASRLHSLARDVPRDDIRDKVRAIAEQAGAILDELERDLTDFNVARRFLEYYLDATLLLVERYVDLSQRASSNVEAQRVLDSFDSILDRVLESFRKQHDKLLRDDVLDLDTEIDVLKRMIEMEGL